MKKLYEIAKTEEAAKATVKFLLDNGVSAYRQGREVWVDDGGYDWGL